MQFFWFTVKSWHMKLFSSKSIFAFGPHENSCSVNNLVEMNDVQRKNIAKNIHIYQHSSHTHTHTHLESFAGNARTSSSQQVSRNTHIHMLYIYVILHISFCIFRHRIARTQLHEANHIRDADVYKDI